MKKKVTILAITAILTITICGNAFAAGRVLSHGTSGDDVYSLQSLLAAYGYFYEEPTGYFGDMTQSALISFQYDYGLEADGLVGPMTSSYLGLVTEDDSYTSYPSSDVYDQEEYYPDPDLARVLRNGMSGADVYTLQTLLSEYGYFYGEATGFFGDMTENAVINFQYDYGLDADGVVGPGTIGALTGSYSESYYEETSYFDYAGAVLDAISWTPATGSGYCAAWVTQVLKNAGVLTYNINNLRPTYYSYASTSGLADSWYADSTGFNANDYWAYVCYSTDINDLQPGMVVATRSSYSYLGRQFGHVGIYIGNGQIISSVGYLETLSFDEWNRRYNNTEAGSSIAWGYVPM